jgi:HAE1 family hydrophobic/amphiphilic exporter-1
VIPGITIPLALLGSFGVMYLCGFSINNLSLMALTIAIGFVVDDAIVVVENIYRHVEEGLPPLEAALKGSRKSPSRYCRSAFRGGCFHPGPADGRDHRPDISRIRRHCHRIDCGVGHSPLTLAPMLCSRCMNRGSSEHGRVFSAIEKGFNLLLSGYRRTLDLVLRRQAITLGVFFATLALTIVMAMQSPKGFFPLQGTGLITAVSEGGKDISPDRMMRLQRDLGEVILSDPDVQGFASQTGNNDNPTTANTGRFSIVLKPHGQRKASASEIIDRLRAKVAQQLTGVNLFMQVTQDINVGVRFSRGGFEYTLQAVDMSELIEWSQKLLDRMQRLPELTNVSGDLLAKAPQLNVKINRDHALRCLRSTAGDAILYSAQYQPGGTRNTSGAAERCVIA